MEYKYSAIMVEPRKHKAIEFVLKNICHCLSDEWNVILFHGNDNEEYVKNIINNNHVLKSRINAININIGNLDLIEYSKLFATKSIIYDYIMTEIFLVFQTDSMIFEKNKNLIYNFLEYDYVGSPWLITNYLPTKNASYIGNGGFSLRKKSKMFEIIDNVEWNKNNTFSEIYYNNVFEDLYFSTNYDSIKVNKPEYTKAIMFCVDEVFNSITLACHKPWNHSHYEEFKLLYPEVEILRNLQDVEN